jgi:hypothetical protein
MAALGLGPLAFGVAKLPPRLCRPPRAGVTPPIDTLDGLGVVVLAVRLFGTDRALSSCFAVIPIYLLARDPTVILLSAITPLLLVLFPKSVRTGRASSSGLSLCMSAMPKRPLTELETARVTRAGVVVVGLDICGSSEGVARPCREYDACDEASER